MAVDDFALAMRHEPVASMDELLAPDTLGHLAGEPIDDVRRLAFGGGHAASGSHLLAIETNGGTGPRFILKRVSPTWDWIMRATDDRVGREALAWISGLLDRLPPETGHPIVACARDGEGSAILMRDVSDALFPPHDPYIGAPISTADDAGILDSLAALHVRFWDDAGAADPALGFCTPEARYFAFSPEVGRREAGSSDFYPRIIREGWELLPTLIDPGLADLIAGLADDPRPLTAALARYPQTVVHGDPRPPNLGLPRTPDATQLLIIDWQLVGPGAPGADLSWYLYCSGPGRTHAREAVIARYRDCLANRLGSRFSESWWQPHLELCLLGQTLRCAQDLAWAAMRHDLEAVRDWARSDLIWWSEWARKAARRI